MPSLAIRLKELDADELEEFIEIYVAYLALSYDSVLRLGQANDKGRDVVGFRTARKHEGPWDLFQSKRKTFSGALAVAEALGELGKVFHHHCDGAYRTLPARYVFVTPRGVTGPLRDLILNPSDLKAELIAQWDACCAGAITARRNIPLSVDIRRAIETYAFENVSYRSAPEIVRDPLAKVALSRILGLPPEDPPLDDMHADVQDHEMRLAGELRSVYEEDNATPYLDVAAIQACERHGPHFFDQRQRFFAAAWHERTYRDSTSPAAFDSFKKDVYHGSIEVYRRRHASSLERVDAVMASASQIPAAFSGSVTRSYVRQGVWHQFVNEGTLRWAR